MSGTDPRSVVDFMKYWEDEAILAELDTKRHNFSVVLHNELKDLNLGNCVRSCNAFLADRIIMLYRRKYDRRSAIASYKYQHFYYAPDVISLKEMFNNLSQEKGMPLDIIAVDNVGDPVPIHTYQWKRDHHTVLILGHEGEGIRQEIFDLCDNCVYIPQYGSVRSLNIAVAAGIVMHEFVTKNY